jgi:hypothetical protein
MLTAYRIGEFQILTTVTMKSPVSSDITPCSLAKVSFFTYCLFHAGFLLRLLLEPEDGGHMFIRNVC